MMMSKRITLVDPNSPHLAPTGLQFRLIWYGHGQSNSETRSATSPEKIGIESSGIDEKAATRDEMKASQSHTIHALLLPLWVDGLTMLAQTSAPP